MKRSCNILRDDCTTAAANCIAIKRKIAASACRPPRNDGTHSEWRLCHIAVPIFRIVCILWFAALTAWGEEAKTEPLIRGTLWWLIDESAHRWTRDELRQAIDAQRAVGFDLLWVLNAPRLMKQAVDAEARGETRDVLGMVHEIANEYGMQVIVDLPKDGWYGKNTAEEMAGALTDYARQYHARYGKHSSFHGWYLNHEINPIAPEDAEQSAFWRKVWRETVSVCHELAPKSLVTISPFFLLDKDRKRGFVYQLPDEYAAWWGATLRETGIDVLMLQDSGEHLAFFTLEDREPFWAAAARACRDAGAAFWLNVESGEADVRNWDEYLWLEAAGKVPWRFTPMPWLGQKLCRAARYADRIVNWGYFPYMDPDPRAGKERADARSAYDAYKAWYDRVRTGPPSPCDGE